MRVTGGNKRGFGSEPVADGARLDAPEDRNQTSAVISGSTPPS
jgi:hypothetical protein